MEDYRPSDRESQIVFDACMATGAVLTGRRTGDFADYWGGDHHDGVPIYVPTHAAPADNPYERVHYVTRRDRVLRGSGEGGRRRP